MAAYEDLSDAELLAATTRDPEAFGVFYTRHAEALVAYLYRRVACAETAADLAAETFAQAFLSRSRYRDTGVPCAAWLFGIARHQLHRCIRSGKAEQRARRRLGIPVLEMDDESIQRIEALVDFEPMKQALIAALEGLSPAVKNAVSLRVAHDLPYPEVAVRLGCSEGTARVRVSRGLTMLAARMETTP